MELSNSQYNQIRRIYDELLIKHRHFIEARTAEVYNRIPQLRDIEDMMADVSANNIMEMLLNKNGSSEATKAKLAELEAKRIDLLKANGYSPDYLVPEYECLDCKDTGFIDGSPCHCFKQRAMDVCYDQYTQKNIMENQNFSSFDFSLFTGADLNTMREAYNISRAFCDNFDYDGGNILFSGTTGTGKTFLSNCIGHELLNKGKSVLYFTAFGLFEVFEKKVFAHDIDVSDIHDMIFDCELLIIDDLGTEMANSFSASQLYHCLNERLLRKRSTIISTNLTIREIADRYSERVSSRIIADYKPVVLGGKDLRIESLKN